MPAPQSREIEFPPDLFVPEAEIALLAAIMADNSVIYRVNGWLEPTYFGDPLRARIFEAMRAMAKDKAKINSVTLLPYFAQDRAFADWEGMTPQKYLVDLAQSVVSVINGEDYGRPIVEAFVRRKLMRQAEELTESAINDRFEMDGGSFSLTPEQATAKIIADNRQKLLDLEETLQGPKEAETLESIGDRALQAIEASYLAKAPVGGIPTGLVDLDKKLGGFFPGELVIGGGRPGMGKTVFAATCAWRAAYGGIPSVFFSKEMSSEQLFQRILAMETGIGTEKQRTGKISDQEFSDLIEAKRRIGALPIHIIDEARITTSMIEAKARGILKPGKPGIVIIDYLQLITGEGGSRNANRVEELTKITRELKLMAKSLRAPVLALSQINRGVEGRDDKRPQLADLRESGSIEQDADQVLLFYREEYYLERNEPRRKPGEGDASFKERWNDHQADMERCRGLAEIIVGKQRFGSGGAVKVAFLGEAQRFDDLQHGGYE
ncbi:MAG TPA: DnaB-like helicase C-terminal domain-containing protein [Dongiaceae bacterium]|nr:DnaB-like helicase C-terminal domain-containing protein [Dongiaceae bacterium]